MGNGLLHDSATTLAIASGQSLTLNGQGLTNERTMTLAGGLFATDEIIGDFGTGAVFTQTGGTNTASGALTLAKNSGSRGTYNLQRRQPLGGHCQPECRRPLQPDRRQPERRHL